MPLSAWVWAIGAGAALVGGAFALGQMGSRQARARLLAGVKLTGLVLALLAAAAGVGTRAWDARAWPGAAPADALALLTGGGLMVAAWQIWCERTTERTPPRLAALRLTLIGAAALLAAAAALAALWPASPAMQPAHAWVFGLRSIVAGIGLGGWLPALAASVHWYMQTVSRSTRTDTIESPTDAVPPDAPQPARPETVKPEEDPGRIAALLSFAPLTAACLASGAWNMIAYAAIDQAVPANLWLLAAWLLGGAYLTITSSWRPLRLPGWLSPFIAAGTFAAGVLAACTAPA